MRLASQTAPLGLFDKFWQISGNDIGKIELNNSLLFWQANIQATKKKRFSSQSYRFLDHIHNEIHFYPIKTIPSIVWNGLEHSLTVYDCFHIVNRSKISIKLGNRYYPSTDLCRFSKMKQKNCYLYKVSPKLRIWSSHSQILKTKMIYQWGIYFFNSPKKNSIADWVNTLMDMKAHWLLLNVKSYINKKFWPEIFNISL